MWTHYDQHFGPSSVRWDICPPVVICSWRPLQSPRLPCTWRRAAVLRDFKLRLVCLILQWVLGLLIRSCRGSNTQYFFHLHGFQLSLLDPLCLSCIHYNQVLVIELSGPELWNQESGRAGDGGSHSWMVFEYNSRRCCTSVDYFGFSYGQNYWWCSLTHIGH